MIPIWLAIPTLLASSVLGWGIDRALGRSLDSHGPLAWPLRAMLGLSVILAVLLHPIALFVLGLAFVVLGRVQPSASLDTREARPALAVLALGVLAIALRPALPLYWDEPVWLAKVRLGPLALREAALDPSGPLVPRGYPIVGSMAESLLAAGVDDLAGVTAGPAALVALALACVLALLPPRRVLPWVGALLTMPLVFIHLRSAHLDLVVGLLSLAIGLALADAREGRRSSLAAALPIAFLLAGAKDEGLAHVVAITAAHVIASRDDRPRALREAGALLLAALASFATYRVMLALHGIGSDDHAVALAGLAHAGAILVELSRAATDVASFGLAWPITLGTAAAAFFAHAERTRALALTIGAQAALLAAGLLLGTDRLVVFTLDGTVAARLLVQLAPMAAWLVCEGIYELTAAHAVRAPTA